MLATMIAMVVLAARAHAQVAETPAPPPDGGDAGAPPTQSSDDGTEPPKVIWG